MNRLLILCEKNKPKCSGNSVVSAHIYGWDEGTFTSASLLLVKLYCFWLPQPAPFFLIVSLSLVIPPHLIWWIICAGYLRIYFPRLVLLNGCELSDMGIIHTNIKQRLTWGIPAHPEILSVLMMIISNSFHSSPFKPSPLIQTDDLRSVTGISWGQPGSALAEVFI